MELSTADLLLRLGAASALCALVGLEREARDQTAGLRTHMLVGLGAALFTVVSAYGFSEFALRGSAPAGQPSYDPTRISAQIVSGIGFLGAGAILRLGASVRGVTTAASLWIVAAIGMAAGAGYYEAAAATAVITVLALTILRPLRDVIAQRMLSDQVVLRIGVDELRRSAEVLDLLAREGVEVRRLSTHEEGDDRGLHVEVRLPEGKDANDLVERVCTLEGIEDVEAAGFGRRRQSAD